MLHYWNIIPSLSIRWSVGLLLFLKGREVTLPCSYRCTCFELFPLNYYAALLAFEEGIGLAWEVRVRKGETVELGGEGGWGNLQRESFRGLKSIVIVCIVGGWGIISTEITRQCLQYFDWEMLVLRL